MTKQKGNKAIATKEQKLKVIEEYKAGIKTAKQIAEQFGSTNKNLMRDSDELTHPVRWIDPPDDDRTAV